MFLRILFWSNKSELGILFWAWAPARIFNCKTGFFCFAEILFWLHILVKQFDYLCFARNMFWPDMAMIFSETL